MASDFTTSHSVKSLAVASDDFADSLRESVEEVVSVRRSGL